MRATSRASACCARLPPKLLDIGGEIDQQRGPEAPAEVPFDVDADPMVVTAKDDIDDGSRVVEARRQLLQEAGAPRRSV